MASRNALSIFVSSTCFDLQQVRRDIEEYLSDAGYEGVLSDSPASFAVNPWAEGIVDACRRAIRASDLVFLVVGGRYGHVPNENVASVTNLEYQEAISFGLPVLTFVDEQVLAAMKEYERLKRPDGFTHHAIDDVRVFRFIAEIQSAPYGNWIFPFRTAQDIVNTTKAQLSYLFSDLVAETRKSRLQKELAYWAAPAFGYIKVAAFIQAVGSFAGNESPAAAQNLAYCLREMSMLSKNAGIAEIELPLLASAIRGEVGAVMKDEKRKKEILQNIAGLDEKNRNSAVLFQIAHSMAEGFFKQNITNPLEVRYGTAFTEQMELGATLGSTALSLITVLSGLAEDLSDLANGLVILRQITLPLDAFEKHIRSSRLTEDAKAPLLSCVRELKAEKWEDCEIHTYRRHAEDLRSAIETVLSEIQERYHQAQQRHFDRIFHHLSLPGPSRP